MRFFLVEALRPGAVGWTDMCVCSYDQFMNSTARQLEKFKKIPLGLWLFSRAICFRAPYFGSIKPTFIRLEKGQGEAKMKKCRRVQNHIGTVHAIAMANLCEFVAGTTLEISLPSSHRWIPKSMKIDYLAKASTSVVAKTKFELKQLPDAGSFYVLVDVLDTSGTKVVLASIEMYISKKKIAEAFV